jgi:hypothetical protein
MSVSADEIRGMSGREEVRNMPFGDGTGPRGIGPMTGRGAGYCAGFGRPGFASLVPVRGGVGFGRGRGRGGGRGISRRWFSPYWYYPR